MSQEDHCHCDAVCRPIEECSECQWDVALITAAVNQLLRDADNLLKFWASTSGMTFRREAG